ncbi:very short patch repair endonuclease [Neomegalonema sp.]|uniref:very short patch repair endonuclease n=1 Tax=Neomegalonema sp. TaxID=2039713 RepID=UPI00262A3852|nr:very short patch repair endonuclease [Neomegalonema sp.]MDD2868261.1 very short patch repair endonuclease [Neomegalonema sp.]
MERSEIMRRVRGVDTGPEMKLRRILRGIGAPGYRLHWSQAPGRPDVAYPGLKLAFFVHGCFWHGHDCPRGAREPKTNAAYWRAKIARNKARDAETLARCAAGGWRAEVLWECGLRDEAALRALLAAILAEARAARPRGRRRSGAAESA